MSLAAGLGDYTQLITLLHPVLATFPRFMTAFAVMPLLTRVAVPMQIRVALLLCLVSVAYPGMAASLATTDWGMWHWIGFVVKEMFIGGMVGYAVGMILWMLTALGDLIDVQAGLTNAQIFDPFGGHPGGPMSVLLSQLGALMFLGFGGLQVFMQLLYESLVLWPPGAFTPDLTHAFRDFSIATSGSLLEGATRLAAPVVGALLIVELGIGLINRAAPQLNTFYFSMPIKSAAALLVLALLLAHLADTVRQSIASAAHLLPEIDRLWRH
ncbi:type III secretion system export apparatus subunit SctT [Piscinibacter terrae]|nr:type III secretion system export apparatus subunit SctT [Albitalea terrae]